MTGRIQEYRIIGRKSPSEDDTNPPLYKMRIFALNEVVAKSRYWYFLRKLKKIKKSSGQIVSIQQVFEKNPLKVKNYGIWLRYNSRSGIHNMYKEYREMSSAGAVNSCYQEMAARHRARFDSIHIIRVEEIKSADIKRQHMKQLIDSKLKFPLPHGPISSFRPIFSETRPSTFH